MNELNRLRVYERRRSFPWTYFTLDGVVQFKVFFLKDWWTSISCSMDTLQIIVRCFITDIVMPDCVADPCPYCNKWINKKHWKKMFEEERFGRGKEG